MYNEKEHYSIARMAKVLEVSESGYYKWVNNRRSSPSKKDIENRELTDKIFKIYAESRGSLGSRKITKEINKYSGYYVNHKRVERIMREKHWFSKASKKYVNTTDSKHNNAIADNLLDRNFTVYGPNEKMVSDTTVIDTAQGKLYIAGILDLYGRVPVGFAMSKHNDTNLVIDALKDMIARGKGCPGCIIHSDRGATYTSKEYRILLSKYDFICSMSKKGDCWDNAPMESFWGKLKSEWLKDKYVNIDEAKRDVIEYVWQFYLKERPHESNGYLTPYEYYNRS